MNRQSRRLPSLNALRAFEAASRHLNFRLAGLELGVTQGAVAQQIRALETELALRLFERLPRGLALTQNGHRYAANVRRAFDMLADATESLRPEPENLTVSVTPTLAAKWLIPRLGDFTRAHPHLTLRVLATERLSHFFTDNVDLAVRYGRPPFGPGLNVELLFEERLIAVTSASRTGTESTVQAQVPGQVHADAALVLLHDSQSSWDEFLEHQGLTSSKPFKSLWFNQTTLTIDAALMGQGAALVQQEFVQRDLLSGRLVKVFSDPMSTDAGYYLVWPRKPRHPEAIATVRSWMLSMV
ncbi:LysR family glycine cleavage system transcriptional activator [Acidovorax delafieldii]|uniref:LysR family glycine cleavage system transcriptional activator n=1 Tax=Acidovorax delafieldii TaxID=47920 RepID=A0AAJ2C9E6_ACIDE|nr:LysR substrate-binding domain-containing protein [Acidovorax delafieldii]MDR6768206.1 LysR family glycine cleavage system transcriptional activator [Acidovorax delafieldii]MDR6837764.1 LysR family glycine cleavage system transcriptional activator [Acidovorax delafieldii]MDR7367254.1 LysR family glycine cleavage system transcriptional activator [Acidovorax delafieldii]